jgi:hypothetical protein
MTQGRATTSKMGSTKVEPQTRVVPPAYAGRIGLQQGNHATDAGTINVQHIPMYEGRGLSAPTAKCTSYPKGSQK